jgi:hypothetical protein
VKNLSERKMLQMNVAEKYETNILCSDLLSKELMDEIFLERKYF